MYTKNSAEITESRVSEEKVQYELQKSWRLCSQRRNNLVGDIFYTK